MTSLLEVKNLQVHYGGMTAINDISFKVNSGEIISILGSNGAGKSTLMKVLSGIKEPTSGDIYFEGKNINDVPDYLRVEMGIVQVPEGRRLFKGMTVEENLIIGSYNKFARKERKENLEKVYELLPRLKERRKQLANSLSGGEQQMVAIGRALMSKSKLLLMDEPSLGLAPIIVKEIFSLIENISQSGITIILSEQNIMQTLKIVDRSYVLENGQVALSGTGEELLNNKHIKKTYLGQ